MISLVQKPPALRVGISALFDPDETPHARTFLRALAVARNVMPGLGGVQWHFLDDGANAARGAEVARQMIEWKADLIVGHFSSDAAVSAAALYQQAGIALLTPAATIDCLTQEHSNAFRFCPSDRQLAGDLVTWLRAQDWRTVHIDADNSAHGQALAQAIGDAVASAGLRRTGAPEQADVEVFVGRLQPSREHWQARRQAGSTRPLVMTDDAVSPHLGCALPQDCMTYVIGFGTPEDSGQACPSSALHRTLFGSQPHTYYRESLLMFHVLAMLATSVWRQEQLLDVLNHTSFDTPMGAVSFDHGECRGARTRLWHLTPGGLLPAPH